MTLPYSQDLTHWQEHAGDHAFEQPALDALKAIQAMDLPLWVSLEQGALLDDIVALGEHIRDVADDLIVIGTGGSGLSGKTLVNAFAHDGPRQHYVDNADPVTLNALMASLDLSRSFFLIISKSGGTSEVLAMATFFDMHYKAAGLQDYARQWGAITMEGTNPLRNWAEDTGMQLLAHPSDIGGRYSVFTAVGMVPAAAAGLDVAAIAAGAVAMAQHMRAAKHPQDTPALHGAMLSAALHAKGFENSVVMPYVERLAMMAAWCRQCWAESLGKDGKGLTAIRAQGAVDQHSQLQLYLDGPKNKSFTMLCYPEGEVFGEALQFPTTLQQSHGWLEGVSLAQMLVAQQEGTIGSLKAAHCPVREIRMERLDESVMGAMLMHWMFEVIALGDIWQINAFDQPAVEDSKLRMRRVIEGKAA